MNDHPNPQRKQVASFGSFRLYPAERLLEKDGVPLVLGSRALDILIALVERAGEIVSKRDLVSYVWPDITVDDSSLRVHIACLRKVLGDGEGGARYVTNVPGRGYCFVAPIARSSAPEPRQSPLMPARISSDHAQRLPGRLIRMVGRDETVRTLFAEVMAHRFVTVVGPGGMGKTTVAVSVAHALLTEFDDAVCFIDLGSLTDPRLVAGTLASTLGLLIQPDNPLAGLVAFLRDKRLLLVLDNCEHVIEAAALLAEQLFSQAPHIHILATSREALRVEGERVHQLLPLDSPPDGSSLTAAEVQTFPAVQLFMERAAASGSRFELTDTHAPIVAGICSRLDGIALAIELAAGRVGTYGIEGTAGLLDNRFRLHWQGRRTALVRHQTLNALLDWSYNLLSEYERLTLRRLSGFVGAFTLEAAQVVAAEQESDAAQTIDTVGALVAKSLLSTVTIGHGVTGYRLLETTRTYALEKLAESGEADIIRKRHAIYFARHLECHNARLATLARSGGTPAYTVHLGNVRAALEWCFGDRGDVSLGTELVAGSAALFLDLSLLGECHRWCGLALTLLDDASRGAGREMDLQEALAISAMFTKGNSDEVRHAITRGLDLAEMLGDGPHQLRLLAGLNIFLTRIGDFRGALAVAEQSEAVARKVADIAGIVMADWLHGVSHHLVGNQAAAQHYCEIGFARTGSCGANTTFFGHDHRIRALVVLARTLWLRGYPSQATEVARRAIAEAAKHDQPVNVCISLVYTASVFLWCGDWSAAENLIERLIAHAERHAFGPYHAVGLGLKGELLVRAGDAMAGRGLLRLALKTMEVERHNIQATVFASALAESLATTGRLDEALTTIAGAIRQAERIGDSFDMPELVRIKGYVLAAASDANRRDAEACLLRSLDWARRQSALSWELRSATTLARLWSSQGRPDEAQDLLAKTYGRFTEGFETSDLKVARHLLDYLRRTAVPN